MFCFFFGWEGGGGGGGAMFFFKGDQGKVSGLNLTSFHFKKFFP